MRIWLTSFLVLFGMAEIYEWVKDFTVPLPVYILGGAFLAIASNYDKRAGFPFWQVEDEEPESIKAQQTPAAMRSVEQPRWKQSQTTRPISFTIRHSAERSHQSDAK